ncbi:MAG: SDR family NAD(P)-dependent oxidoreductase [Byssovorax sp.]
MSTTLNVDMAGKVALVTGATSGIGKEIARGLARLGATVILGVRSPERGDAAREEITKETGNTSVSVLPVDVAEAASIRGFAAAFRQRFDKLHVLVNNAGAWFTDRRTSQGGVELTLATNVLGPHLLTSLLLEPLRAAAPSRVVNVVSSFASDYDATDLQFERRKFDGLKVYSQSKQAFRMLTWGLATQLAGSGVTANAAAPGFVRTDFNANAKGFTATMINLSARLFAVSPAKGADTPLWVAVAPELEAVTGKYFEGRKEKDGKFRETEPIADLERRLELLLREKKA